MFDELVLVSFQILCMCQTDLLPITIPLKIPEKNLSAAGDKERS